MVEVTRAVKHHFRNAFLLGNSQNRQAEKDRIHARLDYEVNLKAEVDILALHGKLDELRDRAWRELLEMQTRQLALLDQLEKAAQ